MTIYKKIIFFLLLIILFLPPFFSGGNNIFVQEIIFILINICWLLFLLPTVKKNLIESSQFWSYLFLSIYFFVTLISVLVSTNFYVSAITWINNLNCILLFLIISKCTFKKNEIIFLVKFFVSVAVVLCLVGIYFYLFGSYFRLTSTFYWPNPFAGYLLLVIPLAFYWFFTAERLILPVILLSIILSSFILCDSRGAFLSLGIILIFIILLSRPYFQKKWHYLALVCFFSLALALGLSLIKSNISYIIEHHQSTGTSSDISTNIKIAYWRGAINIAKKYPLFGSGPATFATIYPSYQAGPLESGKYAHNWYLEILAETGPLCLIFFLLFIGSIFFNWQLIKGDLLKTLLALGIIGSVIHNGLDIDWHFFANYITFFFMLGLLINNSGEDENGKKFAKTKYLKINTLFIGVLVSVLLIFVSVILLFSNYNFRLGQKYQTMADFIEAEEYYQKSLFLNPDPNFIRQHGIILYSLGLITKNINAPSYIRDALAISKKLIKIDSNNSLNFELNGKIYLQLSDYQIAEKSFKKAIEIDPYNHPGYYRQLAEILVFMGKKQEAKEVVEKIFSFYPAEMVESKKILIMPGQTMTSGVEKEIDILNKMKVDLSVK